MSFRLFTNRLFKNGRYFLQCYCKRDIYTNILEHGRNRSLAVSLPKTGGQNVKVALRNNPSGIFRLGQHARKLFIDNILNRVTTTYCADLRTKAVKKLFYGDSAPFFALIGVSLASGAGVLTKEDELEGVCWEIREAANRIQNLWNSEDISKTIDDSFNIDQLDVGPPIAKGCAAVVYAASFKNDNHSESSFDGNEGGVTPIRIGQQYGAKNNYRPELMSPLQNMSRFVHNFGGSVDNLHICNQGISLSGMFGTVPGWRNVGPNDTTTTGNHPNNYNGSKRSSLNEDGIWRVNSASERLIEDIESIQASEGTVYRYPLALKMMFNYDIQSNALSILRAMYKETIPARKRLSSEEASEWEKLLQDQTLTLAPHPNIVLMFGYFCGEVRNFRDGHILYPVAQPPRINPQGYGRNMSLYLLMKRYDCSLNAYLNGDGLNSRTRILLFAQLLEAITHLNRHGVAHRDLKSDNILIELNDDNSPPLLVLSDFGCCLADKVHGLQIPYNSFDIDKGGNAALMAPEIMNKTPGTFSVLNYSKSDLWACGAIGYEIFGERNPFYARSDLSRLTTSDKGEDEKPLRNVDYQEIDLPTLGDNCPHIVQELIYNILNPNPNKRLSPDIAANVMQLYLWAPSAWLKSGGMPSSPEVLQWLLSLTTKIMCEGKHGNTMSLNDLDFKMGRRTYVEYVLICSFLARARLRRIRAALTWIQTVV